MIVCQATMGWVLEAQQWTGQKNSYGADFPRHSLHTCMTIPSSLHSAWNLRLVWCFDLSLEEKNVRHTLRSLGECCGCDHLVPVHAAHRGAEDRRPERKTHLGGGFLRPSWRDGKEPLLLLQKMGVWFLVPASGSSQLPVTSASGDLTRSSGLWKDLYTHSHIDTYANI